MLCLPCKFFKWKYIRTKKKKLEGEKIDKNNYSSYSWIVCKYFPSDKYYFYSYSQVLEFTNYSYSYCTELGSANLFLFLFAGKITIRWSLTWYNMVQQWTTKHDTTWYNSENHNMIQHGTTVNNTTLYHIVQHCTTQHDTTLYSTVQRNMIQHCTTLYNTTWYYMV